MIYQHPLGYLIGMEGLAPLRASARDYDYDQEFVAARLAEVRQLLDDQTLHPPTPGCLWNEDATGTAYEQWSTGYDNPRNGPFDLDERLIGVIVGARTSTRRRRREGRSLRPGGWRHVC